MKKLKLTNGGYALIDDKFFKLATCYKWYRTAWGYALRWTGKREFLHHFVLGGVPRKGFVVDHINGNKLDDRIQNLRVVSHKENIRNSKLSKANTSGIRGVARYSDGKKWIARIMVDYKSLYLGVFEKKEDAIRARHEAEIKYFNLPKT